MPDFPITLTDIRRPERGEPKVVAVFSFRYDAALVPDLIANLTPFVHAYVALDETRGQFRAHRRTALRAALHAARRAPPGRTGSLPPT